ncbi:MAG: vanadium-dependent haloperoxidase [Saprospiraceae bacterium]|nr:vanadium-dependent haloperoxidase [Saprospiraceae bacterium]
MKVSIRLLFLAAIFIFGSTISCNKSDSPSGTDNLMDSLNNDVYHEWLNVFLELDRYAAFFRPGPAPRALAYMGLSAYESCLGGMPEYQTLQHRFGISDMPSIQKNLYWPEVINASYAYLMYKFFESVTFKDKNGNILNKQEFLNKITIKEKELKERYHAEANQNLINNSEAHGYEVAASIWRYSISDNVGHNGHLNPFPNPVNSHGCDWVPTDLAIADRGLYSQWGQVRRFAISSSDMDALISPFECDSDTNSVLYAQAYEMYVLAKIAKKDARGDLEHMAEFWSDDRVGWTFSPPGRLFVIADQIVENENFNLEKTCLLYAQLGLAENDAAVNAWYNKYKYNVERPVTYINRVFDPNFKIPWLGFTPPFPAYPSGHSTFAFAGVGILEAYVGSSYQFTDYCHQQRTDFLGAPRAFNSLRDLANENAFSRLPLGVHYRMDYDGGNFCGILCARKVLQLPWKR